MLALYPDWDEQKDSITDYFWGEWARLAAQRGVRLPAQAVYKDVDVEEVA